MPYIERYVKAGRTIEVKKYYTYRYNKKGEERKKREEKTSAMQEDINRRKSEEKLRWTVNENFSPGDYHVTFTYQKENRPETYEKMKQDLEKCIRKIRQACKKENYKFRYIYVYEIGSKGAMHIHMVMKKIDTEILRKSWTRGRVKIDPLDETGQYKKLAAYLMKYSDTAKKNGYVGRRWNPSKNLRKPKVIKRIIKDKGWYRKEKTPKKGYYIDKETVREGVSEVTGCLFFEYTMVKLE